jgi:hypothetical protein
MFDSVRAGSTRCLTNPAIKSGSWHDRFMDMGGKLQLKDGQTVAVVAKPDAVQPEFPEGVSGLADPDAADAVIVFVVCQDDLAGVADPAVDAARVDRLAWVAYPKGGQLGTDLNRDRLAALMADKGLQPVRQVAIDDTWSALRFRPA